MGRGAAEKTGEALWVLAGLSMDPLSLDMMIIVVVMTEVFFAEVGVLEGVLVSGVTAMAGDKDVELVCGVWIRVEKASQEFSGGCGVGRHCSGGRLGWYLSLARALFCGIFLVTQGRVCSPQVPMCCPLQGIHAT
jgi:hypothetical protein